MTYSFDEFAALLTEVRDELQRLNANLERRQEPAENCDHSYGWIAKPDGFHCSRCARVFQIGAEP